MPDGEIGRFPAPTHYKTRGVDMRMLITGAANGIGRAVAMMAAERMGGAAKLALVDRDGEKLGKVAASIREQVGHVETIDADLADAAAPRRMIDTAAAKFGGLDSIISNAGMIERSPLSEMDAGMFDRYMAVNTRATLLLGQAAFESLKASRGTIVATASIASEHPTPPLGAYATSKAALVMLVRQMALEWAIHGIRCNCVSPGTTFTAMNDFVYPTQADKDRRADMIPLKRVGVPDDIAQAILFLAGPLSSYITGVNLLVDGGLNTMLMPASGGAKS